MKTNKKEEIRKSHTGKLIALALVLVGALVCIFWMFRNLEITKLLDDIDVKQSEFESKSKCIEHRDEIETKMSKTEWTSYKIEDVFYSKIENSCLFSVIAYKNSSALTNTEYGSYMIWDYFDDDLIFYRDTTLTNGDDIKSIYLNAVDYLLGKSSLQYDKALWMLD